MAERRPLVIVDGDILELPSGDTLPGAAGSLTWTDYATRWDTAPTVNSVVTSPENGTIYDYTLDGVTRFRFVPDSYDPANDAFYAEVGLSTLIAART